MKNKCFLPLLVLMMLIAAGVSGQSRLVQKGDKHFDRLAYNDAINWYLRAYKKDPLDQHVVMRIAESYRLTKQYSESAEWYDKMMGLVTVKEPIQYFYYGHVLLQDRQYDKAKEAFEQFSLLVPEDPRGEAFLRGLENLDELLGERGYVTIQPLPVNSFDSDFGAVPYREGIVFASSRDEGSPIAQKFDWLDDPFLSMFYAEQKSEEPPKFGRAKLVKGDLYSRFHESNFTYASDDSSRIYFTRNNYIEKKKGMNEEGVILLKIYTGVMDDLEPKFVQEFPYNSDDYSCTHPCLSRDGDTLFFTSDMPGGFGGKDLYKCIRSGEGWGEPINLGSDINTPGDEMFPYIHPNGALYFASDGHPGLGHLDIFWSRVKQGRRAVVNMGSPINSAYDDFAIWMDETGENGYFSSDRPGGKGNDDIYKLKIKHPDVEILVVDSIANLPLEGVEVTVHDRLFDVYETYVTDSTGKVEFNTDFGNQFEILTRTTEFPDQVVEAGTEPEEEGDSLKMLYSYRIALYNPPPAISAIVIDEETRERLVSAEVEFIALGKQDTTLRFTDRNGRFAMKLERNTYYQINVRKNGYLTYSDRVSTTAIAYDGDTIIPLSVEKIKVNQTVALEGINYDFDKSKIREDMKPKLDVLVTLMKDNPSLQVELGSHTDCRGSDAYNEALSERRARAAVNYIISQGIERERITAKGYGEYQPMNRCIDGVYCSEDEHYQNRRTEYKIIGVIPNVDMNRSILDTRENAPKLIPYEPELNP